MRGDWTRGRVMLVGTLLITTASWPALTGDKVYDDVALVHHELLDGLEDLPGVFTHGSDYFTLYDCAATKAPPKAANTTYRPLPLATFTLVNAVAPTALWPHHVASLALHLLACLWLLLALTKAEQRVVPWTVAIAVLVFGLHPVQGEAYQYINGRSDVLAGAALAGMLLQWRRAEQGTGRTWLQGVFAFLLAAIGMLSKEPFAVAALGIGVVWILGRSGPLNRAKRLWPVAFGTALSIASVLMVRKHFFPLSTPPVLRDQAFLRNIPHALMMGVESLFLPIPRPMRGLMWELYQPWTSSQLACIALSLLVVAWLLLRRRLFSALLVAVAAATLAPTAYVANFFWLGFDRYLYMPLMLVTMAVVEALPPGWCPSKGRPWRLLAIGLLTLMSWQTASFYQSTSTFVTTMAQARPEDPSPYVLTIGALDKDASAIRKVLAEMPSPSSSPIAVRELAHLLRQAGLPSEANALVERALTEGPHDAQADYNRLELRRLQGRVDEAMEVATRLLPLPDFCLPVRSELWEIDADSLSPPRRTRLLSLRNRGCP